MKKLLSAVILFLAVMALCVPVLAAEITITTEPATITSAGSVNIKINIKNDSNQSMTQISCVGHGINNHPDLYSQTLPAGQSLPVSLKNVGISAEMLGVPQTYAFTWLEGSTRQTKDVTVVFGGGGTQNTAAMTATRNLSKDSGKEGDKITLTYTLKNPSVTPMTEVTVKDTIAGTKEIIPPFTLDPGVSQNVTYEYTLGKENATSQPTITYKVNGELKSLEIAAATIKISNVSLQASVTQTEPTAQGITFTIVLTNQGNQDISKITVTDDLGVKVNEEPFSLKAGEENNLTHVIVTDTLRNVFFTISGTDASGQPYENRTKSSEARPFVSEDSIKFALYVTVIEPLSESGRMKVRFGIQNDSTVEMTNATITEQDLGVLETRDILESGETIIEKELRISEPRELKFTLAAFDPSGKESTYHASVPAAYMPTMTTDPQNETPAIEENPEEPIQTGLGGDTLITVLIVLAALMGVAGIALLVLSIYERKKNKEMPDYEDDDFIDETPKRQRKLQENDVKPLPARNAPVRSGSVSLDDTFDSASGRKQKQDQGKRRTFAKKTDLVEDMPEGDVDTPAYSEPQRRNVTEPHKYPEPRSTATPEPKIYEPPKRSIPEPPAYTEPPKRSIPEPPAYTEPPKRSIPEPPKYTAQRSEPVNRSSSRTPAYSEPPSYAEPPSYNEPPAYGEPPAYNEPPSYDEATRNNYAEPSRFTEPRRSFTEPPIYNQPTYNEPVRKNYGEPPIFAEPPVYDEPVRKNYGEPPMFPDRESGFAEPPSYPLTNKASEPPAYPVASQGDTSEYEPPTRNTVQRVNPFAVRDNTEAQIEPSYKEEAPKIRPEAKNKVQQKGTSVRKRVHRVKPPEES